MSLRNNLHTSLINKVIRLTGCASHNNILNYNVYDVAALNKIWCFLTFVGVQIANLKIFLPIISLKTLESDFFSVYGLPFY